MLSPAEIVMARGNWKKKKVKFSIDTVWLYEYANFWRWINSIKCTALCKMPAKVGNMAKRRLVTVGRVNWGSTLAGMGVFA